MVDDDCANELKMEIKNALLKEGASMVGFADINVFHQILDNLWIMPYLSGLL